MLTAHQYICQSERVESLIRNIGEAVDQSGDPWVVVGLAPKPLH